MEEDFKKKLKDKVTSKEMAKLQLINSNRDKLEETLDNALKFNENAINWNKTIFNPIAEDAIEAFKSSNSKFVAYYNGAESILEKIQEYEAINSDNIFNNNTIEELKLQTHYQYNIQNKNTIYSSEFKVDMLLFNYNLQKNDIGASAIYSSEAIENQYWRIQYSDLSKKLIEETFFEFVDKVM